MFSNRIIDCMVAGAGNLVFQCIKTYKQQLFEISMIPMSLIKLSHHEIPPPEITPQKNHSLFFPAAVFHNCHVQRVIHFESVMHVRFWSIGMLHFVEGIL